jgi:hypothetical protein
MAVAWGLCNVGVCVCVGLGWHTNFSPSGPVTAPGVVVWGPDPSEGALCIRTGVLPTERLEAVMGRESVGTAAGPDTATLRARGMLPALGRMLSLGLLLPLLLRCAIQLGVRGVSLARELSRMARPEDRTGDDSVAAAAATALGLEGEAAGASTRFRLAVDTVSASLSVGRVARS